jgi:hypothetical protein
VSFQVRPGLRQDFFLREAAGAHTTHRSDNTLTQINQKEITVAGIKKPQAMSLSETQERLVELKGILQKLPAKVQPSTPGKA